MTVVYAKLNQPARAQSERSIARGHARDVLDSDLIIALASTGDRRSALSWLRRPGRCFIGADVSSDPRFAVVRDLLAESPNVETT
jgi:hypothetical protein